MTRQWNDDREARFAEFLRNLAVRENRSALAALRRGLSSTARASAGMHRYVAGWLTEKDRPSDEQAFYLVAALFGCYPTTETATHNFGGSYRELHIARESGSIEHRFVSLLAADAQDLGIHLRHAVSLLCKEGIAVDWSQLLRDLRRWNQPGVPVQRRWAREFWKEGAAGVAESDQTQEQVQDEPEPSGR